MRSLYAEIVFWASEKVVIAGLKSSEDLAPIMNKLEEVIINTLKEP